MFCDNADDAFRARDSEKLPRMVATFTPMCMMCVHIGQNKIRNFYDSESGGSFERH